ncbi:MAG: 30S ribosomal protein S21 [Parcubacteria group bacterium]|nr:30S ribosomal protein S21 [Parcubacteria group bacterium]
MNSSINVGVTKNANESNASLLRRFTKRMQGSGVLKFARANRYIERPQSKFKKKARALKRITKYKETAKLKKLGRIA